MGIAGVCVIVKASAVMASNLEAMWEAGGAPVSMVAYDDDNGSEAPSSSAGRPKAKAGAKAATRARGKEVTTLSSSFHCWKLVPVTCLTLPTCFYVV